MNPFKLITKPIGCLCSLIGALILGFFLLGLIGYFGFNHLAPQGVKEIVETRSGFPVTVDEAGWHVWDSAFISEDIIVQNPPNFPEKDFLHIRSLALHGDAKGWIMGEEKDVDSLTLEIENINWVITSGGSSNVVLFSQGVQDNNAAEAEKSASATDEPDSGTRIRSWKFKIGVIEVADYSRGEVKREKHIIDREWRFENSESADAVVMVISRDLERQGLSKMMHTLLTAILSVPDIEGLKDDLNPAPDWLKDKLNNEE